LRESQSFCLESEQIGGETLNAMGRQREQMYAASGHLEGANNFVSKASILMKDMNNRTLRNKVFLYCVIVALIVANAALLIHIIKKKW